MHSFREPFPVAKLHTLLSTVPVLGVCCTIRCSPICEALSVEEPRRRSPDFHITDGITHVGALRPGTFLSLASQVLELRPKVDWNKGSAVNWILDALDLGHRADVFPIYLGDDITDEDAFVAMETRCAASHHVARIVWRE